MKRQNILLIIAIALSISGCAYLKAQAQQAKIDYQSCKSDPSCYSEAQHDGDLLGSAASIAGAVFVPAPIANTAGKVVAVISTGIFGWWLGRKKRKDSQPKV